MITLKLSLKINSLLWKHQNLENLISWLKKNYSKQVVSICLKNIHKEITIKKIKYDLPEVSIFKQNLKKFKNELSLRRERFLTLKDILEKKGFNIGSLKEGANPWRLNCWYGNRNYLQSKQISDNLRKKNIRVSHWYIPLSAFLNGDKISCKGAKMFNKGLMQFWLDKEAEDKEYNLLNKIIM